MKHAPLKITAIVALVFLPSILHAGPSALIEKYLGWKAYEGKKYDQAQEHFSKSLVEDPKDPRVAYNLGNAYYRSGNFGKAGESFLRGTSAQDLGLREKAFYNLGNSLYRSGEWEMSAAAYENALKLDPKDEEARLNLEFVKKKIEEKKRQEQKPPPSEQAQKDKQESGGGQGEDSQEKKESPKDPSEQQNQGSPQDQNQTQNQPQSGEQEPKPSQGQEQKPEDSQNQAKNNPPPSDQKPQEGPPQKPEDSKGSGDTEASPQKESPPEEGKLEAKKEDSERPDKADRTQTEEGKGKLSQKEAEQWLGAINEDPTKILKDQIAKKLGRSRRPEKDW